MTTFIDLTGARFGRLVVIARSDKSGRSAWECRCDCGKESVCLGSNLNRGKSKSCGCLRNEMTVMRSTTHGQRGHGSTTREYEAWCSMIGRCSYVSDTNYHNYGARGIAVCERWRVFENFFADMGNRPSPRHSIERNDVNGNYEPSNCHWATKEEQMRNRRILKSNSSGVNGVYLNKSGKYHAQIRADGRRKHIGLYDTLDEAAYARKQAEIKYWGESPKRGCLSSQ